MQKTEIQSFIRSNGIAHGICRKGVPMKKADYLTLAKTLRAGVYKWSPTDGPILGETVQEYAIRQSLHCQAVNMARYLHQHLAMPEDIKAQFLELCGIRPLP